MIYTSQTGALNTNAAIKPSGTAKHHIAPIFPFISNFASPPAGHRKKQIRWQKNSVYTLQLL